MPSKPSKKPKASPLQTAPLTKWEEEVLEKAWAHRERNPKMSVKDAVELAVHQRRLVDWMQAHPRKPKYKVRDKK